MNHYRIRNICTHTHTHTLLFLQLSLHFLPSATVVAERLCFYRCLSVHRGGGVHPLGIPHWADTPLGRHPHPWADTPPPEMATAADGRHHTGMHSCFNWTSIRLLVLLTRDMYCDSVTEDSTMMVGRCALVFSSICSLDVLDLQRCVGNVGIFFQGLLIHSPAIHWAGQTI